MNIKNDTRPWGSFREFTENEKTSVKLISVSAGQRISLQTHSHRSEFWRILSGNPILTTGETVKQASAGDEFFVPAGVVHRIEASSNCGAEILEITFGEFDENDIVRIEDSYGRVA